MTRIVGGAGVSTRSRRAAPQAGHSKMSRCSGTGEMAIRTMRGLPQVRHFMNRREIMSQPWPNGDEREADMRNPLVEQINISVGVESAVDQSTLPIDERGPVHLSGVVPKPCRWDRRMT